MVRAAWWRTVRQFLNPAARRRGCRQRERRLGPYQPWLEDLEGRLAPTVTLSISNPAPFPKPDTGQLLGTFVVTRSGDLAPAVQVHYQTQDGSGPNGAHAGVDYTGTAGTLLFAANQTMATITVPILGNSIFQTNKMFTVSLSNPTSNGVDFAPPQTFAIGQGVHPVAVGDFNGDGKPDLAIISGGGVSVLLNTTPARATIPTFAPPQTFAAGLTPGSVAVGDFNGDGKPDLVIANVNDNTVSVLLNTTAVGATTPSFAPQQTFATGAEPAAVAVGDFNGDGRADLVVASGYPSTVSVLLNTTPVGATTLSFAPRQTFTTGSFPDSIGVGDFNGDGKLDLAVASRDRVSVLLNTTAVGATTPSFAPQQSVATGNGITPVTVAVGDFNGDGKPDLAFSSASGVSVLLNTTAAATTLSFAPQQTFPAGSSPGSVEVGDFNGDGKPDLAVLNGSDNRVSVLLNTTALGASTPSFAPQQTFATGSLSDSLAVGDFNGDGKLDLAVTSNSNFSNTVSVLLNTTPSVTITGSPATGTISSAPEAPTSITVVAGTTPQSATINTSYATPLAVDVRDAGGTLVQGVTVTFTAPYEHFGSCPTCVPFDLPLYGTFDGSGSVSVVVTNASGRATAPTFTANNRPGTFTVVAQATGGSNPSTSFSLTNLAANPEEVFAIGLDQQVYGQKLGPDGTATGGYFRVANGAVKTLSVGYDARGRRELFVIGLDNQVYALKFDDAGNPIGSYFLLAGGAVKSLRVGHDRSGRPEVFVIGLDDQVYAEKLDATDSPQGSYFLTSAGAVKALSVGQNAAGPPEVFVIGLDDQVYAQQFDGTGSSAGPYFPTQTGRVKSLSVGSDASGGAEVFVLGLDNQVYAQRFDSAGRSASGYFLTQVGQVKALTADQDARSDPLLEVIGLDDQVYAQHFNDSGSSISAYTLVQAGRVKEIQVSTDLGHLPEVFVTGLDDQIYGQKFDRSGNPLGGYFLIQAGRQKGFVAA
jgi:hypothetical protein